MKKLKQFMLYLFNNHPFIFFITVFLLIVLAIGIPIGYLEGNVKEGCLAKTCLTPHTSPYYYNGHCICVEIPK